MNKKQGKPLKMRLFFFLVTHIDGNGLGLYIVDTVFKTMDISYSFCAMEEPQGMRFTIHL